MKDIENKEDILLIMSEFYKKLLNDNSINFFFNKITNIDQNLQEHLEILVTFWEQVLFLKGGYYNNMFQIHKNLNEKYKIEKNHYDIWLNHLYSTVDQYFKGDYADKMKSHAFNMANILQIKL